MAHFAKIGKGNVVERVVVVNNDAFNTEQEGVQFLQNLYGARDLWKQTSYNTHANEHRYGGTPFRKNFANIGDQYDEARDAFISPKPFNSWVLNETTCQWEAPVAKPNDENKYKWSEENQQWEVVDNS